MVLRFSTTLWTWASAFSSVARSALNFMASSSRPASRGMPAGASAHAIRRRRLAPAIAQALDVPQPASVRSPIGANMPGSLADWRGRRSCSGFQHPAQQLDVLGEAGVALHQFARRARPRASRWCGRGCRICGRSPAASGWSAAWPGTSPPGAAGRRARARRAEDMSVRRMLQCSATLLLDLLDGDPAVVRLEQVVQHFLGGLQRDRRGRTGWRGRQRGSARLPARARWR